MSGAVPPPAARPLGRPSGVPRPVCPGLRWRGRGDPAPAPQRVPLRPSVACRGGVPGGGGAFCCCEGRLRSGAPVAPAARPPGGLSGSTTHVLWAWVCGCGGPALSPWLACPAGVACCGGGRGPSSAGVAWRCCEGPLVSGAVPLPIARPLKRAVGVPRPVCPGCGWRGRGDPAPASLRAPLWAGVARCGGGGRAFPRDGAFCRCEGRLGSVRRSPSPGRQPPGRAVGVHYPCAVGVGVWLWGSSTVPLACMPCRGCVPRGRWKAVPGEGGLPPLWGASGVRRSPSPGRPSSGAGSRGSAARVSRVRSVRGCGPSTGPTACAPLWAGVARCWGGRRAFPGGVPFAVVRGV